MRCFKHNLNQIFKGIAVAVLLLGLGSTRAITSARHIHYRPRISRHIVRHPRRRYRGAIRLRKRKNKRSRYLTRRQIKADCSEIDRQTIKDVNNDRRKNRLPALKLNHQLSKIGNQRSYQLHSYFSHNTKQRSDEAQYLLDHKKIHYEYYGENIASSPLGMITMLDVGPYDTPNDTSSRKLTYRAKNGYQLANNINNASMYHDEGDGNGHRDNDLSHQFRQLGVGVSYNSRDKNFYIAIEFIG